LTIDVSAEYTATIRTNRGNIKVELFPGQAPNTVNSFVFLANQGFFNGLIFHRVIENFMIQGGDPQGTGTGGPGYQFQDEIDAGLTFDAAGKLAMANSGGGTGTNGSQFFVTTVPTPHLSGNHTIFGQVTEGQDVVDAISRVDSDGRDRPLRPVTIEGIYIVVTPRS
jgi:peptidyl-prolyl cis-trans isomerase B (cyclophilin B)